MKKVFLLTCLLLTMAQVTSAEERKLIMKFQRKTSTSENKEPNRAPMRIPVEVVYDTETYEVKVIGDETIEAEVFLYDSVGNLEDYSATLNTYFYLYTSDTYTVHIEGV